MIRPTDNVRTIGQIATDLRIMEPGGLETMQIVRPLDNAKSTAEHLRDVRMREIQGQEVDDEFLYGLFYKRAASLAIVRDVALPQVCGPERAAFEALIERIEKVIR